MVIKFHWHLKHQFINVSIYCDTFHLPILFRDFLVPSRNIEKRVKFESEYNVFLIGNLLNQFNVICGEGNYILFVHCQLLTLHSVKKQESWRHYCYPFVENSVSLFNDTWEKIWNKTLSKLFLLVCQQHGTRKYPPATVRVLGSREEKINMLNSLSTERGWHFMWC